MMFGTLIAWPPVRLSFNGCSAHAGLLSKTNHWRLLWQPGNDANSFIQRIADDKNGLPVVCFPMATNVFEPKQHGLALTPIRANVEYCTILPRHLQIWRVICRTSQFTSTLQSANRLTSATLLAAEAFDAVNERRKHLQTLVLTLNRLFRKIFGAAPKEVDASRKSLRCLLNERWRSTLAQKRAGRFWFS